ncbi:MAG: hypothetical protein H8E86_07215 [Planctomycetes bacterium]|nr:hypothetical protein [Planctomycetota bacterium]
MHVLFGMLLAVISSCFPASEQSVEEILENIEAAKVSSLTANVVYIRLDPILDRREIRTGKLLYRESDNKKKEAAILFDTLTIGRRREEKVKHFIFSGRWMAEVDHDKKQFIKRELIAPGEEDINPFELGSGPIPLPIGQSKESILAKFNVVRIPKPTEGLLASLPEEVIGLHLLPKEDDEWESIDLFYNPKTWLPVGVNTIEIDGTKRVSRLTDMQMNVLSQEEENLLSIKTPDPQEWSIDIRPWVQ